MTGPTRTATSTSGVADEGDGCDSDRGLGVAGSGGEHERCGIRVAEAKASPDRQAEHEQSHEEQRDRPDDQAARWGTRGVRMPCCRRYQLGRGAQTTGYDVGEQRHERHDNDGGEDPEAGGVADRGREETGDGHEGCHNHHSREEGGGGGCLSVVLINLTARPAFRMFNRCVLLSAIASAFIDEVTYWLSHLDCFRARCYTGASKDLIAVHGTPP